MKCPYCGFKKIVVKETRRRKNGESIKRRKECLACGKRFSTVEFIREASGGRGK